MIKHDIIRFIKVKTSFEGIHKYPKAPKEVDFLRNPHRHTFFVTVKIEVFNDDRDIEFIIFKRFINSLLKEKNLDYKSCEMISDELFKEIIKKYPERDVEIEISEDNENSSVSYYEC